MGNLRFLSSIKHHANWSSAIDQWLFAVASDHRWAAERPVGLATLPVAAAQKAKKPDVELSKKLGVRLLL
jgi:hypothetical protein